MQAAEALCHDDVAIFRAGGEDLTKALRKVAFDGLPDPDYWLGSRIIYALSTRNDLIVTGEVYGDGFSATRIQVPSAALQIVASPMQSHPYMIGAHCSDNRFIIHYPDKRTTDLKLYNTRIEVAPPSMLPEASDQAMRPVELTKERLSYWYELRVDAWPPNKPPPTAAEDLRDAIAKYGDKVTRDQMRAIRAKIAPAAWKKQGPRGPRNSRRGLN